jgi:hypothetical protein
MTPSLEFLTTRVRGEYHEMPGLSLTVTQASRFLGIPLSTCETVLGALVSNGVLYRRLNGTYVAASSISDQG